MEVTVTATIPDDAAAKLQNGSATPLGRRLLELATIKAYEAKLITVRQVQEILGLEDRFEVDALFKTYDVRDPHFTLEELEQGRAALSALLSQK